MVRSLRWAVTLTNIQRARTPHLPQVVYTLAPVSKAICVAAPPASKRRGYYPPKQRKTCPSSSSLSMVMLPSRKPSPNTASSPKVQDESHVVFPSSSGDSALLSLPTSIIVPRSPAPLRCNHSQSSCTTDSLRAMTCRSQHSIDDGPCARYSSPERASKRKILSSHE